MITLNLVYRDKSDIGYDIQRFPDGQQNIVLNNLGKVRRWYTEVGKPVIIVSRLRNFLDLELIACAVSCIREVESDTPIHLYVPYFVGARSDRKFEDGGNRYLKDVICPIVNSLKFKTVTVLDPHSYVLENLVNNFRKRSNYELVSWALSRISPKIVAGNATKLFEPNGNFMLVSPDEGASKKIYKLAEQLGYKGDIITCSKERGVDGKLSKVEVSLTAHQKHSGKDYIIIDDICDGGATFINIAKAIRNELIVPPKIYLIVTHGIFSKGFGELSLYFDNIFCTNSYADWSEDKNGEDLTGYVQQANVFS